MSGCDCVSTVNAKLAEHNGILLFNFLSNPPRAMIATSKRDEKGRKKAPLMEATFCPFCGTRYPTTKRELARELVVPPPPAPTTVRKGGLS